MQEMSREGRLDGLDRVESLRSKVDHLVGRFRSAPQGYSGFFDYVRVQQDELDEVYAVDASLFGVVDELAQKIEGLVVAEDMGAVLGPVADAIEDVSRQFDRRGENPQWAGPILQTERAKPSSRRIVVCLFGLWWPQTDKLLRQLAIRQLVIRGTRHPVGPRAASLVRGHPGSIEVGLEQLGSIQLGSIQLGSIHSVPYNIVFNS